MTYLEFSPLRALINGQPAVIMFFVISGFVLALPFSTGTFSSYTVYLTRRACRIYIPFVASIFLAAAASMTATATPITSLSDWAQKGSWTTTVDMDAVVRHLLMTGNPSDMHLNNVMWSLVHEIRISIIFPAIALLLAWRTRLSLIAMFAIWSITVALNVSGIPRTAYGALPDTFGFMLFFALGAALCMRGAAVLARVAALKTHWAMIVSLGCIAIFAVPPYIAGIDLLYGIASAAIIALCATRQWGEAFTSSPPIQWLGQISYSLYLLHLPISLMIFDQGQGLPTPALVALAIIVSLAAAQAGYWLIEQPATKLGRKITSTNKPNSDRINTNTIANNQSSQ